jgi:uncharacterized integral membrane protein
MNAKALFKTVFLTALLVLLLLMAWHNRMPADFTLLPVSTQTFHGPIALMGILFFGIGMLMGLGISIRTERKEKTSSEEPTEAARISVPRIGATSEPPVGSRIS